MDNQLIQGLTIREILKRHPETISVFIQLKTQCAGCAFERFCTLEDLARHYGIPYTKVKEKFLKVIQNSQ
jgi:hybrid cluster-associated redox disulfide protein